jgi:hypothetical protein
MSTGTHTVADLLSNRLTAEQRVAQYGEENLVQPIMDALEAHNRLVSGMLVELADETDERQETYGADTGGKMKRAEEHGRVATEKGHRKGKVAYPFYLFQHAIGFTREYMLRAKVSDLLEKELGARTRHLSTLRDDIRRALFLPTNETVYDTLRGDDLELVVRRLLNADGEPIPTSDAGTTFSGDTHTHYVATTSVSGQGLADALAALIDNVVEHDHVDDLRLNISQQDEGTVTALPGFLKYVEEGVVAGTANERADGVKPRRIVNRPIGRFRGAEVWTRTWVPAGYYHAYAAADRRKPLAMRVDPLPQLRGLKLAPTIDLYPLRADYYEARFGFGVKTRTNGAVLWANAGSGSVYAAPAGLN